METNLRTIVLNSISKVYNKSNKSKLKVSIFDEMKEDLTFLAQYFKLNNVQAFFIANIIALNFKGKEVEIEDLNKHFRCSPFDIMQWSDEINSLVENGYVKASINSNNLGCDFLNTKMTINNLITEAILKSEAIPPLVINGLNSPIELMEEIYKLIQIRINEDLTIQYIRSKMAILFKQNKKNPWVKYCEKNEMFYDDVAILSHLIWKTLMGYIGMDLNELLDSVYGANSRLISKFQDIINEKHELVNKKMIETKEDMFLNGVDVSLSGEMRKELKDMGIKIIANENSKNKNILSCQSIIEKTLFYNTDEKNEIDRLQKMLDEEKLQLTRKRLDEKKLPKGVIALFYGSPGTGKTESVKQLAKATGREIFKVDISDTKSMWFGQSEKIIKQVFTDYNSMCAQSGKIPILLFNEADAVLSSRKENVSNSIDQTMNAIQNILLEEFENFDGILIATTNLTKNLDSAFERRFLFKVEFKKPSTATKAKIWQNKIDNLSKKEALLLAEKFDFSGGQIDNIARKKEIEEIVNDKKVGFDEIMHYCTQEYLNIKQVNRVGFNV